MAKKHSGITVAGCITGIVVVVLASTVAVETGVYARIAPYLGLQPIYSLSGLMPTEQDMRKNNLGLNLSKPTTPETGSVTAPTTGTGTGATIGGTDDGKEQAKSSGDTTDNTGQESEATTQPAAASGPYSVSEALKKAESFKTADPHPTGYDRANQFGTWQNSTQLCGYGTTRDLILKRDMTNVVMDSNCHVQSGTFNDPYTGKTIKFQRDQYSGSRKVSGDSSAVQIDHVVALQDAWASGLWKESRKTDRVKYANDPDVLLASDGTANNTKSMGVNLYSAGVAKSNNNRGRELKWLNSTPSVWLPDNTSYDCAYMAKRVYIKTKWNLTMSSWEKNETVAFLKQCAAN
ncbi:DUF1524 domain-containing protein [Bifidobacterium sp. SO1]|uniref:GmrSD restriction endonuclease domain-containing protein n=1 Tax=Bifidobacterium sp. SO1 TaxID=2809029 RepID=UPI001BDCFEB6|nr:DUF1524 domain-containing protein [Bifidobacterium sp. SO1]MBT1162137.1 HNH endonuclease [Bifidobacterium sp. SO1]